MAQYQPPLHFWEVFGCSRRRQNLTKRDGKHIRCGHRHATEADAAPCLERMRAERPGNCQDYRAVELWVEIRKRKVAP
jgi:hypothetical protein